MIYPREVQITTRSWWNFATVYANECRLMLEVFQLLENHNTYRKKLSHSDYIIPHMFQTA